MIEVSVKLTKGHIFLTGETLECVISFSYPESEYHKISQSNTSSFENLAWASAQIYCQCFTDPKVGPTNKDEKNTLNQLTFANTSLNAPTESGQIILATKPKILFCDIRLYPGQTRTFTYQEKIPSGSPPSYRGQVVKYSYKITVGTQRVNHAVKMIRVPIRVLPLMEVNIHDAGEILNETTEELTPTNPFLEVNKCENPLNVALQTLQIITSRRNPNFYMISNKWGKVARFCLFKSAYKLGEDIVGSLDFTVATVNCMQVSVSLQCQEEANVNLSNKNNKIVSKCKTFSKHHEVCFGYKYTQLILPIPLYVTPDFSTDLVTLKWNLHFEFVTSTSKLLDLPNVAVTNWQAPTEIPIETMVWSLPINLYSTTPLQVSQGLYVNDFFKLKIR